jgi:aryl-alcohol dehydrogenase-like predicted oxidoreductase
MRQRPFGATGLVVSAVGMGCSRLGGMFSTESSARDEVDLVRAAVDAGITFFDTSDFYSHGQSEILVGKAVKRRRNDVVLATKGGFVPPQARLLGRIKPALRPLVKTLGVKRPAARGGWAGDGAGGGGGGIPQDFTPDHLATALEASLRRLGTDYIDVYQLHSPSRAVMEAGEYVDVLDRLKAQGKIRHYGIAADHARDLVGITRIGSVTAVQLPFSVIDQTAADGILPEAAAAGVGVITRSCFAAGLLVGSTPPEELRRRTPDAAAIVSFRDKATELGRAPRELALQFCLAEPTVAVTIVGMHARGHLDQIVRDAAAPALTFAERATLVEPSRA